MKSENAFRIDYNGRKFFFKATQSGEKEHWIGTIGRNMVRKQVIMDHDDMSIGNYNQ
jgi:hypothetical protein